MSGQQIPQIEDMLRNAPSMATMTIEELRENFDQIGQISPPAEDVRLTEVSVDGIPSFWIDSDAAGPDRTILFFHSGGYVMGSHRGYVGMVSRLGKAGLARVLFPEYRLAPEHPYPAAPDDAFAAYRWLLDKGTDPSTIAIVGDSAGGALVLVTLLKAREAKLSMPACAVMFSPFGDLTASGETLAEKASVDLVVSKALMDNIVPVYIGNNDPTKPDISPIYADMTGFPPLLFHVGSYETLLDDTFRLARRAAIADVEVSVKVWPKLQHLSQLYAAILDEGQQSVSEAGAFMDQHLR